jgi:cyclic beta-1,2-glucan synthetase
MYRIWVEEILGLTVRDDRVILNPVISPAWDGFRLRYKRGGTTYDFTVDNPDHVSSGVRRVELDGKALRDPQISLVDDGSVHEVRVLLGLESEVPSLEAAEASAQPR